MLAIGCNREVTTAAGRFLADQAATMVPRRAWQRYSCGDGAKGPRYYDWAQLDIAPTGPAADPGEQWPGAAGPWKRISKQVRD